MFIKLNEDKTADKSKAETAQFLVSQCTELQTEVGLYDRVLLSGCIYRVTHLIDENLPLT